MLTVSATNLRNDLFNYLDKVESGEVIVIQRNSQEVARLVPMAQGNWRDKMSVNVQLLVPVEELIQPLEDVSVTKYSPPWTEPKWWGKNTRNRLKSAQNGAETVCFALKSPQYGAIFKPLRMSSQVANNS